MRTTLDLPDALFRKTKALAALEGSSMKDFIVRALEHETQTKAKPNTKGKKISLKLPHIRLKDGRKLDLTGFDFDELLG